MISRLLTCIACLAALGFGPGAEAQPLSEGFALQQYEPTYAGDRFFAVPDASVEGKLVPAVKLSLVYGYLPLRVADAATGKTVPNGELVRHQLYLDLDASLSIADLVRLDVALPVAAFQSGEAPSPGALAVRGGRLSDLRVGARVALAGSARDPAAVGLQVDLFLPTGSKDDFASDGSVRGQPRLVVSGLLAQRYVYAFSLGAMLRRHRDLGAAQIGSAFTYSAAAAILLGGGRVQIGPELFGSTDFGSGQTPLEALAGARVCAFSGLMLGAGAGGALSRAPGSAEVRAFFDLAWQPGTSCQISDADGDGIPDERDACPRVPGVASSDPKQNGCPPDRDGDGIADAQDACPDLAGAPSADPKQNGCPPDRDGDGVPDEVDACPDKPGVQSSDPKKNGCPPDRDGDGIADAKDACPDVAGAPNRDPKRNGCPADRDGDKIADAADACPDVAGAPSNGPKTNGCPADRDGDGVPDAVDACPDKPGVQSSDPKKNGCPAVAALRESSIVILQQIQFESGKARLKPESDGVLKEVAAILKEHPEIATLSVEGHTDSTGSPAFNLALSKERAAAVRAWLVGSGIEAKRLTATGFGMEKPIAPNATHSGRQMNRRVEFQIVSKRAP